MNINWDIIAAVSEAIGAIAVVISLIYLAFQVRQNTRAIRGAGNQLQTPVKSTQFESMANWRVLCP